MLRDRQFFYLLTWKCASRHTGVQLFHFRTSKSAPVHFQLQMCFAPQQRAIFQLQNLKNSPRMRYLCIFTCKCALRHSGVQFFDIRTSKSAPRLRCFCTFSIANVLRATAACNFSASELKKCSENEVFVHFHLQMCFTPQRCAIFRHQNFKKCSETGVLSAFSLQNVLFATAACKFDLSSDHLTPRPPL